MTTSKRPDMPTEYRYAAVNRPPGFATIPPGALRIEERPAPGAPFYEISRHGIVVYAEALSAKSSKAWELAPLIEDTSAVAALCADRLRDDCINDNELRNFIAMADEEPDFMLGACMELLRRVAQGYLPQVADPRAFTGQVVAIVVERLGKPSSAHV